ncbi:GFA family protein [Maritalea sp.]|uniref:GFA family protein n=1 Tax=Maritalea sp. TaxID=2003361 RepID=UPI003EF46106
MIEDARLSCCCGKVTLEIDGVPSMSNECLCDSCRNAAEIFAFLPDGINIANDHGGTPVLICRTDKVSCVDGAARLKEHRLTPDSKTRRVIATCCNTPMFLDFEPGPWISLYAVNWPEAEAPPLQFRMFCNDLDDMSVLPKDVPNGKPVPFGVARRLLWMAVSTGFRTPKITFVEGGLDA